MRGKNTKQSSMLCLMSPEERVPVDHPLRAIKKLADAALATLSPTFDQMYASTGRSSVPPERLLKSMLLIALYSVRSERQFCEQLDYNLLFRWFLDMDMLQSSFDATVFTYNRERLMAHDVAAQFFGAVVEQARSRQLLSSDHFSVDGTLIESWASAKSFRPKDDEDDDNNGWSDFSGQKRSNDTHESKTDPEAKLWRKGRGREAKLSYMGHALMENRGRRDSGARGCARHDRPVRRGRAPGHGGRGPSLRHEGLRRAMSRAVCDSPRCAERERASAIGDRCTDDAPLGLCDQHRPAKAHREHLRLAQERCRSTPFAVTRSRAD
jgi:transposase